MKKKNGQSRTYRKYDESFKQEAVRQMQEGRSVKDLSMNLGVSEGLLYRWRSQTASTSKVNNLENRLLKKELKQLKEDNEILKKPCVYSPRADRSLYFYSEGSK